MTTFFATFVFIVLIFWCGTGPVLLLVPRQASGRRILLLPFIGLCAHILFSIILARFHLTGHTISILALVFFSGLACWGLYRAPLSRKEFRDSAAPLLLGAAGMMFIGWPLFRAGFQHYWGYANPDQIFLTGVLDWIYTHPFGVPPGYPTSELAYNGVVQNTVLGIFYVIASVAAVTHIAPELLFNVAQAGVIFLNPIAVVVFAESLGLQRRPSLVAGACIGCSSLVAYTFHLDSLAALTVIAIVPVALALLLEFGKDGSMRYAVLFAVVSAAMYYNYLGAIGVLGVLVCAMMLHLLVRREIPITRLLAPALLTAAVIVTAFTPFAYSILRFFLSETFSARLSQFEITPANAEVLISFALSYTEFGIPFFWGLQIPHVPPLALAGGAPGVSVLLFGAGCLCFALLAGSLWPRLCGLSSAYGYMLVAAILPMLFYAYRGVGYGVFKLVAWVHPIIITGFIAVLCGLAQTLRRSRLPALWLLPYLAIGAYMGVNIELSHRLGSYTESEAAAGSPQNAVNATFQDVRQLRALATPANRGNIAIMIPDVVVQRWTEGYLASVSARPFPSLLLVTEDSVPRLERSARPEAYVLHWNRPRRDITPPPRTAAVWSNSAFALSRFSELTDAMFVGLGWYRVEGSPAAAALWQQRFRWLRKRAEVLLWNPSPGPQRLLLTLTAGYGNPSPERHVSVFLNGQEFDEVRFSGYARVVTKPFHATPPWSQIELEVREDAEALPRLRPLWAAEVPRDARRLNVAVSELSLIDGSGAVAAAPSSIDFRTEFRHPTALMEGVYPDRWMGAAATFHLRRNGEMRRVRLSGTLPRAPGVSVPFPIEVALDGRLIGHATITEFGEFRAAVPIPPNGGRPHSPTVRLEIKPAATFSARNGDPRPLSVQLDSVGLTK